MKAFSPLAPINGPERGRGREGRGDRERQTDRQEERREKLLLYM